MFALVQLAVFKTSLREIPHEKAAEVDALLYEWALKIEVSIPARCSTSFNHLAIVEEDTLFVLP